ncbi:MAG: hypothetical protein ACTSYI_06640 [Promethearchaeota archaeon]
MYNDIANIEIFTAKDTSILVDFAPFDNLPSLKTITFIADYMPIYYPPIYIFEKTIPKHLRINVEECPQEGAFVRFVPVDQVYGWLPLFRFKYKKE